MCSEYEDMVQYAFNEGVQVIEYDFNGDLGGYYCDGYFSLISLQQKMINLLFLPKKLGIIIQPQKTYQN